MTYKRKKFNIGYFIIGILFLLTSLVAFRNPTGSLLSVVIYFGIAFISKGISGFAFLGDLKEPTGVTKISAILISVIDIIFGFLLITKIGLSLIALPYVFSIVFIFDSISNLFLNRDMKKNSPLAYYFSIVLNILGIIAGFFLLYNPISSALTLAFIVGFYFMVIGISYVIGAFQY